MQVETAIIDESGDKHEKNVYSETTFLLEMFVSQ